MRDRLLLERLSRSRSSTLLLGPRQVGKSTLCRLLGPIKTFNLADEEEFLRYAKDPGRFKNELRALPSPGLVCIDEVQRVPALLNMVQVAIDEPGNRSRFILTGSSARKLKRGGANLLPGRVILEHLDPLSCFELTEPFDLSRALQIGMLPGIYWGGPEAEDLLGTYAEVYLREEVQAEALTKNIGGYARFLDMMAVASGQWINYSKLSSDVEIPKETIRRFVTLLEDTLLIFRIPSFQPRARISQRVTQRDRVLLFDVGVRNALLGVHKRPVAREQFGPLFEQWLALQIIYLNRALRKGWKISSYRTEAGAEVDLVIERGDEIVGVEIKASRNVGRSDLRGLASLAESVGKSRKFVRRIAYLGESAQAFDDGTRAEPWLKLLEWLRREA